MNKTQFIEKSLKKLDDVLQKSHVAYGTTYPPNPELKKLFEDELSECWDMAGEEKKVNITHVSSFLQGAKEILRIQSSEHSEGMKQRLIERLINKNEEWLNSLTSKQEDKK